MRTFKMENEEKNLIFSDEKKGRIFLKIISNELLERINNH